MPGDILDIDSGVAVEIAWVNGDKVIAKVPEKSEAKASTEYHEHAKLIMLSSAYDSGFLTTGEKIYNSVFGFGAKKGIDFIIESIPYVGKPLKEGGSLTIEIYSGLQDIDLSQADIITRIRIRSKVVIDNTGDDLEIYTIEGSPDVETVMGGMITLSNGEMVTVTDEGAMSAAQAFDVEEIESNFYESIPRDDDQTSGSGSSGFSWVFISLGVVIFILFTGILV